MRAITSYINPDLDGVASAILYAEYLSEGEAEPSFSGQFNIETMNVLSAFGINPPRLVASLEPTDWNDFVLVDCHHPRQLPPWVDAQSVSGVIDHHPDGDPNAFPNAQVQNEIVGAAATLIAELISSRTESGTRQLQAPHAALLACAIASNTLDFQAPSTTDRDRAAYARLCSGLPTDLRMAEVVAAMRTWRREILMKSTFAVVSSDVKVIEIDSGRTAISQVEADGAQEFSTRPDLEDALNRLRMTEDCDFVLLSLVDTAQATTTLVTFDQKVKKALSGLHPVPGDQSMMTLPYIALRKTHIIPTLLKP